MNKTKHPENSILVLLRICTCLLAAVSFWATAQGMIDYTFPEDWQAYAASLGIQGLLLGLNFSLPSFLKQCNGRGQRVVLMCLTAVILFCSSWFSYLYIAGQAYGDSWTTESRLLAQSTYRNELFAADTYAKLYSQDVQDTLAEQIVDLYRQAMAIDQNSVDVSENLDWAEERNQYTANDFAASDIMDTVISAMENATGENITQDARTQAGSVLSGMQSSMQSEIANLGTQIAEIDTRVAAAESSLRGAESRLSNAPVGVDLAPYQNAVNTAVRTYESLITRQNELEGQRSDYETALQRTTYYLTILGMAEDGVSSYFVGANLREIQRELFQTSPDSDRLIALATEVFSRLQSAVDLGGDTLEYQVILADMNSFLQRLDDYSTIKDAGTAFQEHIDGLADGSLLSLEADSDNLLWREQFNDLKSEISGLPVYAPRNEPDPVLASFDRAASTKKLDQAIRRYLTEHNAAQAGLIYLISPYREIAVFSLFLALLLDIAAFITGVIIDRVAARREADAEESASSAAAETECPQENSGKAWDIIPGLNKYIFLTGDHTFIDGVMTYKAIENGEETEIEYPDRNLESGFYRWDKKQLCIIEQSVLLFKGASDGPQDGIYADCILHYEDQLLTMTQSGKSIFLGPISSNVPVYQLSKEQYIAFPAKNISDIHGQEVVIALNKEGNRIIAVYVIE